MGFVVFLEEKMDQMKSECYSPGIHITGSVPIVPGNMKMEQQLRDGNVAESIKDARQVII